MIDASAAVETPPVRDSIASAGSALQQSAGAGPSAPRPASQDGDQAVASGATEPVGEARSLAAKNERTPAPPSARALASGRTDSAALAGAKPVTEGAAAQPEVRRRKYKTPDNQGRPESAKPEGAKKDND
ncbi:MAG: hypothetical protein HKN91_12530 [Acidimicrobiia bacterium]|nr:hypothetical protein [Acidimicrobiia bacterium]